jgi:hypothetical protein
MATGPGELSGRTLRRSSALAIVSRPMHDTRCRPRWRTEPEEVRCGVHQGKTAMPEYRVMIEITKSAYTDIEADSTDETRANAEQPLDEGEMGG